MSLTDKIYDLKSEYGRIIKLPLENYNANRGKCDIYCRSLTIGEWLEFNKNITDPKIATSILKKIIVLVDPIDSFDVENIESLGLLPISLIKKVSQQSSFDDPNKLVNKYDDHMDLLTSRIFLIIQSILTAYPNYKIKEVFDMDDNELMLMAAMSDVRLDRPWHTEYILKLEEYEKSFMLENKITDKDEVQFDYEDFIKIKKAEMGVSDDEPVSNKDEIFVTNEGKIVKGNKKEYQKVREKLKADLKNKNTQAPPNVDKYNNDYSEGVDPTTYNPDNPPEKLPDDELIEIASRESKSKLKMRLERERELQLKGIDKSKAFNWNKEIDDVSWGN